MVCQICGKKSGYYPLCAEHFRMRDDGLVIKCKECGKWHLKAEGCSGCSHEEQDSSEIMFERGLLEQWGKSLFRIFKTGEELCTSMMHFQRHLKSGLLNKKYIPQNLFFCLERVE